MPKKNEGPAYETRIEITGLKEEPLDPSEWAKALGAEEVTDPKEIAKWRMKGGPGFWLLESLMKSRKG